MATLIGNNKPSMMAFPSALNRMGTFPIDISSVWYSYDEAVAYATQTNFTPKYEGQTGLPYVGQILTVVETAEDGTTSVTAYSIQNEAGDLAQVGTVTLGDNATIVRDEETGALSLYGIDELTWKETVKDAEGNETEKDVTTYQPKLVKKDGKVVLTWEIPSTITVEGLSTRIQTAEGNIEQLGKDIDAVEKDLTDNYYKKSDIDSIEDGLGQAIEDAIDGLSETYYNKTEIDAKITSVLKFQGIKTYKDELPATGQVVGDVWLVIYDSNTPAEGETNTLPVANIEYVWTTENKWEPLGDDIIDLTNYYTRDEVDAELAKKGAIDKVEDGAEDWSVKVTDAEGNVSHAKVQAVNASNEAFGLVKGDGTNVSIANGVITVNEATHAASANEATHATNADNATEAAHATNADNATNATNAVNAEAAGKVNNKFKVLDKEFDGSEAKEVKAEDIATAISLDSYLTISSASSTYLTDEQVNAKIEPVTTEVTNIKGENYGADSKTPTLMSLLAKDEAFDEALDGLEQNITNANTVAGQAKDQADAAVKTANAAAESAGAAVETANAASGQANAAVKTANTASGQASAAVSTAGEAKSKAEEAVSVAGEAKTKAEEAVGTANTAKSNSETNAGEIEKLKTADQGFEARIAANEGNITKLQEANGEHTEAYNTLVGRVDALSTASGEHAEKLQAHDTALAERYTKTETDKAIGDAIAAIDHLSREVVETLPVGDQINSKVIYLIAEEGPDGDAYIEYMYINGKWEIVGNTRVDFTGYATETFVNDAVEAHEENVAKTYQTIAQHNADKQALEGAIAEAAKTAEWASVSGKPTLSHVETKEETFNSSKVIEVTEGKIRNIEVYDANGEQVVLEIVRNSASKYTLNAVGSTETLTVVYDVVIDIA